MTPDILYLDSNSFDWSKVIIPVFVGIVALLTGMYAKPHTAFRTKKKELLF